MRRAMARAMMFRDWIRSGLAVALVAAAAAACGVRQEKAAEKTALDVSSKKEQQQSFEATAQLLDERPELVDELYAVLRQHPKTMDGFVRNVSVDLREKWLSEINAKHIAEQPASLEQMLGDALVAIEKVPSARGAMNRALASHAYATADILSDSAETEARVVKALIQETEKKPNARKNFMVAIHEDRPALLALVREDPELSRAIAADVLRDVVKDKPALQKALAATGALDEPADLAPQNAKATPGDRKP